MHVKKGDNVIVLAGKDKGKRATILKVLVARNMVVVEGVNMKKKHRKKTKSTKGSIVDLAFPIHASNVARTGDKASKKTDKKK